MMTEGSNLRFRFSKNTYYGLKRLGFYKAFYSIIDTIWYCRNSPKLHDQVYLEVYSYQNQEFPSIRERYSTDPYSVVNRIPSWPEGAVWYMITTTYYTLIINNWFNRDCKYIYKKTSYHLELPLYYLRIIRKHCVSKC